MRQEGLAWEFFLAERLHMSVAALNELSQTEVDLWIDYFTVKGVLADLKRRTEEHGG